MHRVKISKSLRVQIFVVSYFAVFIFTFWSLVMKMAKSWTSQKFPAIRYQYLVSIIVVSWSILMQQFCFCLRLMCAVTRGWRDRLWSVCTSRGDSQRPGSLLKLPKWKPRQKMKGNGNMQICFPNGWGQNFWRGSGGSRVAKSFILVGAGLVCVSHWMLMGAIFACVYHHMQFCLLPSGSKYLVY